MSKLRCALVQANLHWENREANLSMLEGRLDAVAQGTHLVILPEMFSTGFSMRPEAVAETMEGPSVQWMRAQAASRRTILTGSLAIAEGGAYFNRAIWMLPNGQMGWYDKRHLFAYAGEGDHYTAGDRRLVASVNGWRVLLQVCYDLRFPVWARQQAQEDGSAEYDLLLYVANWPQRRSHAWKTLLTARAIENQCFVIGVNRVGADGNGIHHSGDSMVVDPLGEALFHQADTECVHNFELDKEVLQAVREKFPFLRDRDRFTISPDTQ